MNFRILGPIEVVDGDRPITLRGAKQRALLAILLLRANETVATDRLIDELWGERPPDTAATALHGLVSQLRKALDPEVLVTRPPGYMLRVVPDQIDLDRFERLLAEGRRALADGDAAGAEPKLREACELWRGSALADVAHLPFAEREAQRLEDLRLAALEERVDADLALGRHAELVPELDALVAAEPLRERLRGQLMVALYRCGRQAEALESYQRGRRVLVGELGLEPGPELQELERAILRQDPALGQPMRRPRAAASPRVLRRWLIAWVAVAVVGVGIAAVALLSRGGREVTVEPNSLAVLDAGSGRLVDDIRVGARPAAVAVGFGSAWVANAEDGTVTRIGLKTRKPLKTIGLGAPVNDLAAGEGAVWVSGGTAGKVFRIDPRFGAVVSTVDLSGPDPVLPTAVHALAAGDGALWVATSEQQILRLDSRSGRLVARIHVGLPLISVEVGGGAIWASLVGGRVVRIEPRTNRVTGTVSMGVDPIGIAAGALAVWVGSSGETLWRVDPATMEVVGTLPVDSEGGVAAAGRYVWAAGAGGTVSRVDPATRTITTVRIGHVPTDVAVAAGSVWVAFQARGAS